MGLWPNIVKLISVHLADSRFDASSNDDDDDKHDDDKHDDADYDDDGSGPSYFC